MESDKLLSLIGQSFVTVSNDPQSIDTMALITEHFLLTVNDKLTEHNPSKTIDPYSIINFEQKSPEEKIAILESLSTHVSKLDLSQKSHDEKMGVVGTMYLLHLLKCAQNPQHSVVYAEKFANYLVEQQVS